MAGVASQFIVGVKVREGIRKSKKKLCIPNM